MRTLTYARARLWTGITAVGLVVLLSSGLLALGAPARLLEGRGGALSSDAALLLAALTSAALLALPFDVLGGLVLPKRFGRPTPSARRWAAGWARGVFGLLVISTANGLILIAAGRAGGRPAALLCFVLLAVLLISLQEPIARLVGGLRRVPEPGREGFDTGPRDAVFLRGTDPGFSGGFTGLSATLVLPEHWARVFQPRALALLVERRRQILRTGAWRRALALAVAWNASGFLLASLLPNAGVRTLAELITTALGFTLWTFLGLLVLPTPSRRATVSADATVARREPARSQLLETVAMLDRLQDDEPDRSPGLESIFHPVPSVGNRTRALVEASAKPLSAWHLARTALYLSHAGLSQLPRAVHCNVGRPELWVYMPTDG